MYCTESVSIFSYSYVVHFTVGNEEVESSLSTSLLSVAILIKDLIL